MSVISLTHMILGLLELNCLANVLGAAPASVLYLNLRAALLRISQVAVKLDLLSFLISTSHYPLYHELNLVHLT